MKEKTLTNPAIGSQSSLATIKTKMKLDQKQGLKRRSFEIDGNLVKVKFKSTSEEKEWTVDLEHLGHKTLIEAKSKRSTFLVGVFFAAFTVFFITVYITAEDKSIEPWVAVVIGGFYLFVSLIVFLTPAKREIHLIGGSESLTFFLESPSKQAVDYFIAELITIVRK